MNRIAALVYGSVVYGLFLAVFLYAVGFVTGVWVPKSIDSGPTVPIGEALVVNALLMSLFAVQHSVMARQGFKRWWTKIVPKPIERSTYVLATNGVLALLFWQWRPIPAVLWETSGAWSIAIAVLGALGWAIVLVATFVIDHFGLFGLKQVVFFARNLPYPEPHFQVRFFYRHVRHPLLLGFMIAFWAAPTMTYGHALFALVTTLYMFAAIRAEERDLVAAHGEPYAAYRRSVPMIVPRLVGTRTSASSSASRAPQAS